MVPPTFPSVKALRVDYLVDAGPLVGAFWGCDQWHDWSRRTLVSLGAAEVYTTEAVLAEAAHHLKPYLTALTGLLAAVDTGRAPCAHFSGKRRPLRRAGG